MQFARQPLSLFQCSNLQLRFFDLQFGAGLREFMGAMLEFAGHLIEGCGKFAKFIVGNDWHRHIEITRCDGTHAAQHLHDRTRDKTQTQQER